MKINTLFNYTYLITITFLLGCQQKQKVIEKQSELEVKSFTAQTFPKYAKGFSVQYFENYKKVEIYRHQSLNQVDTSVLILKVRNTSLPQELQKGSNAIIEIPIQSLVSLSTTDLALTDFLNANHLVKGVANADFISNPKIIQNIKKGEIISVGSEGSLNQETILGLNPDLILASGFATSDILENLKKLGVQSAPNYEWLEKHPLGRAEWVKFLSYFTNQEEKAEQKFKQLEADFLKLQGLVSNVGSLPTVLVGLAYQGDWFVSGGESYIAKLIQIAGAEYAWKEIKQSGGVQIGFETVYETGLEADIWINLNQANSLEEVGKLDERYTHFKAFKEKKVFNNNKRKNEKGWVEFYETSIIHPDKVLGDLIKIFHPELLPDWEFYYYQKLE